jgi:RNA-directed DNA polymerase
MEGKMTGTSSMETILTKQHKIATLASYTPQIALTTLSHHIDLDVLSAAFSGTRKSGAPGIDGQTARDYEENLQENLQDLLDRFKSGRYKAPPVKRVYIPKGDGASRPIGIPTFEDKILQRAVAMMLEPIYETDFYDCSYGFRPGRSAHQMLKAVWKTTMREGYRWVLEVDISRFFDTLNHRQLREFLDQRVRDGTIRRMIDKWLKAGVMEAGNHTHGTEGTPQGGVISPLLANIYLHYVLDEWFHEIVLKHMRGNARLYRYADDFVICFENETDARRVMDVLPKRFGKYGLELHPEKTRLINFNEPKGNDTQNLPQSFDLLGFTHYWGKTRKGEWMVKHKTSKKRLNRGIKSVGNWLKENRHAPLKEQHKTLSLKLKGHYAYYGVSNNFHCLATFRDKVIEIWRKWLGRRSQKGNLSWEKFQRIKTRYSLPTPTIMVKIW